jgi:exportin-2 (importin alpha re-exporter)
MDLDAKFDGLAISAMKFLATVSSKAMNRGIFTPEILQQIIEQIVVRNLTISDADVEAFEDQPMEYIRKDFEGNDQDTRRRAGADLARVLLKGFGASVQDICLAGIRSMLAMYTSAPQQNWKAKV